MPLSLIDFEMSSGSGPELPMQVVQPKPTRLKPTLSSRSAGRIGQIFRDHLAARRQRGLDPRFGLQALGGGVARQQPGADQNARIRRVGTGGDRRNDDVAMAKIEIAIVDRIARRRIGGLLVFAGHRG